MSRVMMGGFRRIYDDMTGGEGGDGDFLSDMMGMAGANMGEDPEQFAAMMAMMNGDTSTNGMRGRDRGEEDAEMRMMMEMMGGMGMGGDGLDGMHLGMKLPPGMQMPPGYDSEDDEPDSDDGPTDMSDEDMMMMMMMMNSGSSLGDMPPELLSKVTKMGAGGAQSMPIPPTMSKPKTNNNKTNNKKKNKGKKNKIPQPSSYLNKAAGKEPSENKPPPSSFPVNPKPAPSGEPFSSLSEITYGIDVIVRGNLRGKVTFSGSVHYARGDWVGVVLEEPAGKNNGTVKGVKYFSCEPQHGLFVRPTEISRVVE